MMNGRFFSVSFEYLHILTLYHYFLLRLFFSKLMNCFPRNSFRNELNISTNRCFIYTHIWSHKINALWVNHPRNLWIWFSPAWATWLATFWNSNPLDSIFKKFKKKTYLDINECKKDKLMRSSGTKNISIEFLTRI